MMLCSQKQAPELRPSVLLLTGTDAMQVAPAVSQKLGAVTLKVSKTTDLEELRHTTSTLGKVGHHCVLALTEPDQQLTGSALTAFAGTQTHHASVQGGVVSSPLGSWKYGKAASGLVQALVSAQETGAENEVLGGSALKMTFKVPPSFTTGENLKYNTQLVPATTQILKEQGLFETDLFVQGLPEDEQCGGVIGMPVIISWKTKMSSVDKTYRKVHYVKHRKVHPEASSGDRSQADSGGFVPGGEDEDDSASSGADSGEVDDHREVPSPYIVFVAEDCGNPPSQFNTKGVTLTGSGGVTGELYCGYVYMQPDNEVEGAGAVFFVIQPTTWKPYQKRFMTSFLSSLFQGITDFATGALGAVQAGAAIGVALGTVVGGPLGTCIGLLAGVGIGAIAGAITDSAMGEYLRYIGPGTA